MKSMLLSLLATCCCLASWNHPVAAAESAEPWLADVSFFVLGSSMDGKVTVKGLTSDVDVSFGDVLEHLQFGAMGSVRLVHGRWALSTEVIYMNLGMSKGVLNADMTQWVVEPTLRYRASKFLEPLAGFRYNSIEGELKGPFGKRPSGTQDWFDPIVGVNATLPARANLALSLRADIGGFGVGSDLTWQLFPTVDWYFAKTAWLQAGYRFVDVDYETGSGSDLFKYDVLTHGPQVGVTMRLGTAK